MSDEIARRLDAAARAHASRATSDVDVSVVAASVIGKARRQRRQSTAITMVGAFAGLTVLAGGTLAVVDSLGSNDGSAANDLAIASAAATDAPLASPAVPDASAAPSTGSARTITEFPPSAPSRGEDFPAAYEMRDWVWDYVGADWTLESVAASQDSYAAAPVTIPDAVVYLVSPAGAHFEVATLAPEQSAGLRVVSWQEDDRTAHVVWDGDVSASVPAGGGELDLATGQLAPITFSTPWGVSGTVSPLAVSATGNELWEAWIGTHQRFYRFGTADGWTVATVNDLEGINDRLAGRAWDVGTPLGDARVAVRPDSAAVLFELRLVANSVPAAVAVYDVDADVYETTDASSTFPKDGANACWADRWVGDAALYYACGEDAVMVTVSPDRGQFSGMGYDLLGDGELPGRAAVTSVVGYRVATSVSYLAGPWRQTRTSVGP